MYTDLFWQNRAYAEQRRVGDLSWLHVFLNYISQDKVMINGQSSYISTIRTDMQNWRKVEI